MPLRTGGSGSMQELIQQGFLFVRQREDFGWSGLLVGLASRPLSFLLFAGARSPLALPGPMERSDTTMKRNTRR